MECSQFTILLQLVVFHLKFFLFILISFAYISQKLNMVLFLLRNKGEVLF